METTETEPEFVDQSRTIELSHQEVIDITDQNVKYLLTNYRWNPILLASRIASIDTEITRKLETLRHSVKAETRREMEEWFRDRVIEFDQGCQDGKLRFLEFCEIEPPAQEYAVTATVSVAMGTDVYSMRQYISEAINEIEDYNCSNLSVESHND